MAPYTKVSGAVKILLGAYLASRTSDPAIVSRVLSDDRLIHAARALGIRIAPV